VTKNALGSVAATALILWLHAGLAKEARWYTATAGGAVAVICLLLSRSSTSGMAASFAAVLLLLLYSPHAIRRHSRLLVAVCLAVLVMYFLAMLQLVPAFDFMLAPVSMATGKDQSFTGRTTIWEVLYQHIRLRPYLGNGYGAYWTGKNPLAESYAMVKRTYFYPTEGHNGYLDVLNDLGAVGEICLVGYLAGYLRQSMRLLAVGSNQGMLYLALFFQQLIINLSESSWLNGLRWEFAIMTLATFAMARELAQQSLNGSWAARASYRLDPRLRHNVRIGSNPDLAH
jgi:exopolysaccharide production protein ExoQ